MEERLKALYKLQLIDNQLDQLEEMRGDLPIAVRGMEERLNDIQRIIENKQKEKEESFKKRELNENEIIKIGENQKKHKAQLYSVRNNKEYDALTKEIDASDSKIKKLEMENDALADYSKKLENEIEELSPKLDELKLELDDKEEDLKQIIKSNEKEEVNLRAQRSKIEAMVRRADYSSYMLIRKAKKGMAVATIKRSACSGCHNVIPSQRQLEIRRNLRLFNCEYCGRIIVSSEIADSLE